MQSLTVALPLKFWCMKYEKYCCNHDKVAHEAETHLHLHLDRAVHLRVPVQKSLQAPTML